MRTLIRWAARLYPATWRNRYGAEFEALLDDISPSLGDLCDVLGHVLRARATTSIDACLVLVPVYPMTLRLPVVFSLTAHALIITLVLWAAIGLCHSAAFASCGCPAASACARSANPSDRRSRFSKRIDVVLFAAAWNGRPGRRASSLRC